MGNKLNWGHRLVAEHFSPKEDTRVRFLVPPPSPRRSFSEVGLRQTYIVATAWQSPPETRVSGIQNKLCIIYSLKCYNGYYVGCTDNIEERLRRHEKGQVPATASRLPIKLDFYFAVQDKYKAFEFEKYLKSGSGRAFIKKHLQ